MISTRKNIIATTREESDAISDNTSSNAKILRDAGARILHGIDAEKLPAFLRHSTFNAIIFQL